MRSSAALHLLGLAGAVLAYPGHPTLHDKRDDKNVTAPPPETSPAPAPEPAPEKQAATKCNGAEALCDRPYSNITFVGTHNSAFSGTSAADNQHMTFLEQLDFGV